MKKFKTPQEKKALSYQKDTRNTYGENDKSSRKAIPFRKRWVNRTYRKATNQILNSLILNTESEIDKSADQVKVIRRKNWKKAPDQPLGEYLRKKGKTKEK